MARSLELKTLDESVTSDEMSKVFKTFNQRQLWENFVKPVILEILSGKPKYSHFHPKSF
jgi:lysozyme family protein